MALIKCPECTNDVSSLAVACPKCGYPISLQANRLFLTEDELQFLTGLRQGAKMAEQLTAMRVPFYVNAGGRPVVARAAIEGPKATAKTAAQPNWGKHT